MLRKKKSYLVIAAMLAVTLLATPLVRADMFYLDPDTLLLTNAIGTEFDVVLKVDAIPDIKFFQVYFHFNPQVLDTVKFTQGPLFVSSGHMTAFGGDLYGYDTVMGIEDFIFGAGIAVDGPGTLGTVKLRAIAPGKADLSKIDGLFKDVDGDTIPTTGTGSMIFVNYPPMPFSTIEPLEATHFDKYPRDSVKLVWGSTRSIYPGEGVICRLEYGTSPTFAPGSTTVVNGLSGTDTTYTIHTSNLNNGGLYYWRVVATGGTYGYIFADTCTFDLNLMDPINEFDLALPPGGPVSTYPMDSIKMAWTASGSAYPGENVTYTLEYNTSPTFTPEQTSTFITGLTGTSVYLYVDDLEERIYYWRVRATGDTYGYSRLSSNYNWFQPVLQIPFVPFSLLSPTEDQLISGPPSAYINFHWTRSMSVYQGEAIHYRFELATDPFFNQTIVPPVGVVDTTYAVLLGDLNNGDYFWRVTAVGETFGFESSSSPASNYFSTEIGGLIPADFRLLSPVDSSTVNIAYQPDIFLEWEDAHSGDPYDTIQYIFYLGPDTNFMSTAVMTDTVQDELTLAVPTAELPLAENLYWRVRAVNRFDLEHWSTSANRVSFFIIGDATFDRKVNLADITRMIDYVYISKVPPAIRESADINCDGKANLADITGVINNVYLSKQDMICD